MVAEVGLGLEIKGLSPWNAIRGEPLWALEKGPQPPTNVPWASKHSSPMFSKTSRDGLNAELNFPNEINKAHF